MPKKKSSPRKKPARKTSSRRKLPHIAAPETWTREEALRRYVYVLLPQYFSQDAAEDILFYAHVDGTEIEVRPETAQQFFSDHADRTFITYDASAFHRVCMDAFANSREGQAAVWRLSCDYRLWDVALLARRIEYAEKGFASKVSGLEGWEALQKKHAADQSGPWDQLQTIFVNLVRHAVSELPIFRTYWGLGTTDKDGQLHYGEGLPRPISSDECPSDRTSTAPFRRRDLLLCSKTGPLGIGLDLQATIVTDHLNIQRERRDIRWCKETAFLLERNYHEISERLSRSSLKNGFHWEEPQLFVKRDERGHLVIEPHKLQAALMKIWKSRPSEISTDFTPPFQGKSKLSLKPGDWYDYRCLDKPLEDWIRLEVVAEVLRLQEQGRLPAHVSFPELRCSLQDEFSLLSEAEYLQVDPNKRLLSLRIDNLDLVAFLCTFASQFMLQALSSSDSHESSVQPGFIGVIEAVRRDLGDTSRKPKEIDGPTYADLLKKFDLLTQEQKLKLFAEVVRAFVRMEYAASFRRRLQDGEIGLRLNDDQSDVIYWLTLRHLFSLFIPQIRLPFFRIPRSWVEGTKLINQIGYVDPKKKLDPNRLIPQMLQEQIGTKSGFGGNVDRSKNVRKLSWVLINQLFVEGYSVPPTFDFSGDELGDLGAAAEIIGKEQLLKDLLMTNVTGISGRIGVPIRFYERLYSDCCQVKSDLMTSIAFHLIEEGVDLVMVNESGVCILIPQAHETTEDTVISSVIQSIRRSLAAAFPSGFFTEGRLGRLLSVLID